MQLLINQPSKIDPNIIDQMVALLEQGKEVLNPDLRRAILRADLTAVLVDDTTVCATATFKNPLKTYVARVFTSAESNNNPSNFKKELGYIVTNPAYEGNGYCQRLLVDFFPLINTKNMFATTRKESMSHILKKFGFTQGGKAYKEDLKLFVYTAD